MSSTISAGTTAGSSLAFAGDTSGSLQLQTNGTTTAVTIDTSQNVGIGTTSPATKLHLLTPSATAVALRAGNSVSYAEFQVDASGNSQLLAPGGVQIFNTNGAERMRIDSSGNVGIGTSSPGAKLEVTNNQAALSYLIDTNNTTNGGSSIWRMITRNIANTGTTSVEFYKPTGTGFSVLNNDTNASNFTAFNVGSSERMRIDSSGNLLVGTTSVLGGTNKLCLLYDGATSGGFLTKTSTNVTYTAANFLNSSSTSVGSIVCTSSATSYNTSSDYRLKNTIAPMTGALAKVALLKPVTYKWNADGSDGQGFIAHELQEVVEGCVTGEKDATREEEYEVTPAVPAVLDAEGVETTPAVQAVKGTRTVPSYQGVDTSFLVATLTAAIQEAHALIIQLQADVAALKGVK